MATSFVYGSVQTDAFSGAINFPASTVQAILLDSSYSPNQDSHSRISHLTGELTDASYARQTLSSKVLAYDAGTNTLKLTSGKITFPGLDDTFRYLVIAVNMGSPSSSPLLLCVDFLSNQVPGGVDVDFTPSTLDGLIKSVVA